MLLLSGADLEENITGAHRLGRKLKIEVLEPQFLNSANFLKDLKSSWMIYPFSQFTICQGGGKTAATKY